MTVTTSARPSIADLRAAWEAKVRAEFTPQVPGLPGDGTPVVLHHDQARDLTYTWHDRSPDTQDAAPRESGMETSLLAVTHAQHRVGYLRVSFTTKALLDHLFPTPFHWAEANTGAAFGFGYGEVSDAQVWAVAHQNLGMLPASWGGRRPATACSWVMDPRGAPADPAVLAADLKVVEAVYARQMRGYLSTYRNPFVAYAHVDDIGDANRAGPGHPGGLRGTGVGTAMYVLAAQHLAATGRFLIGSGIQSDDAEALWARLVANPAVPTRRTRRTFFRTGQTKTYWALDYTRT